MNTIDKVKQFVKLKLGHESTGHDYQHALRVLENAKRIAVDYTVDLDAIEVACLVHDIIDHKITKDIEREKEVLRKFLVSLNLIDGSVYKIFDIIENISFSKGAIPNTLEGRIVQDADRLDALGAIGIARTFAYGGKNNRLIYDDNEKNRSDSITHFYDKLLKLKDLMSTDKGKEIALDRTKYMEDFLLQFYKELK